MSPCSRSSFLSSTKWLLAVTMVIPNSCSNKARMLSSRSRTIGDLKALTRNDLVTSQLGVALNLMLQDTETNILASPRIRTRNKGDPHPGGRQGRSSPT